jgi:hypothetical protein
VHACTAPVVRLKCPLALGHGYISSITPGVRVRHTHETVMRCRRGRGFVRTFVLLASPGAGPGTPGRCRIATYGRLFEGTDEISLGQTTRTCPAHTSFVTAFTPGGQPSSSRRGMLQNCWHRAGKLVSFWQCRFRPERRMTTEQGRSSNREPTDRTAPVTSPDAWPFCP